MTVEVSKEISAPVNEVYKAWTEPEQMSKWFCIGEMAEVKVQQDLRVDGQYRLDTTKGCNHQPVLISGVFKEIIPNKKLVYSWTNNSTLHPAKDTVVTVEFIDKGKSTLIVLKHTNFAVEAAVTGHNMGWQAVLAKLADSFVTG